jgi:hypothetical protein
VLAQHRLPGAKGGDELTSDGLPDERCVVLGMRREGVDRERVRLRWLVEDPILRVLRSTEPQGVPSDHDDLMQAGEAFHLPSELGIVESAGDPRQVALRRDVRL